MRFIFTHDGFEHFKIKFRDKNFLFFLIKTTSTLFLILWLTMSWGTKDLEIKNLRENIDSLIAINYALHEEIHHYAINREMTPHHVTYDPKKNTVTEKNYIKEKLKLLKTWIILAVGGVVFLFIVFHFTPLPPSKNCKT